MNTRVRIGRSRTAPQITCKITLLIFASVIFVLGLSAGPASAAQIQQIQGFGNNPSGIGMYLYTPTGVAAHPAILVGVHACHSTGTSVCAQGTPFAAQADRLRFLLICPSAISTDGCWDVQSTADLTHNGRGDAMGIISMVNYVVQNNNGDASRVYAAGHSSGGMMTNVLIGSYPDVFKAGAAFAGVAFSCFAGNVDPLGWNATCANGNVTKTGAQWGAIVRAAYPGFTGTRPRMQIWHGTADAIVNFRNFAEEIKEWTNVLGVSETPTSTESNAIRPTWIRTRYADASGVVQVEAIQETGQPHNLILDVAEAVNFFGLDDPNPVPDAGAPGPDANVGTGGAPASTDGGSTSGPDAGGGSAGRSGAGGSMARGGGSGVGSGGSTGQIGPGGSSATGGSGTGGSVAGSGSAAAGTGGTAGKVGAIGGGSTGCSCATGAAEGAQVHGRWPGWLALALGLCWTTRRRSRG
jgi:acetylxylan esterase